MSGSVAQRPLLNLLSAGAAQGLVGRLQADLEATCDVALAARFGAVGAMQELLLAGQACDVMILTDALLRQLEAQGLMVTGSIRPLGRVFTGVAVVQGQPLPTLGDDRALRAALLACERLYVPDTVRSTAGQHVVRVLQTLGVHAEISPRLSEHPNGATAMRTMAAEARPGALGITQLSEIIATPGVTLAGRLPQGLELSTLYSAAVAAAARDTGRARAFVARLVADEHANLRRTCGIEE